MPTLNQLEQIRSQFPGYYTAAESGKNAQCFGSGACLFNMLNGGVNKGVIGGSSQQGNCKLAELDRTDSVDGNNHTCSCSATLELTAETQQLLNMSVCQALNT